MRRHPLPLVVLLAAACSSGTTAQPHPSLAPSQASPTPTTAATGPQTLSIVQVSGNTFAPSSLPLHVGDSVLVTNTDPKLGHTFVIRALHVDSGDMQKGQTFRYRFTTAGTYAFVCRYHEASGMTGQVVVS